MKTTLNLWVMAVRPKTLLASVGPVILGLAVVPYLGGKLDFIIAFLTLFSALLMQVGTNLVNDYFDGIRGTDTGERLGPKRVTQEGLLPARKVKLAYQLSLFGAFLLGINLMVHGGLPIIFIGLLSLLVAYAYTGGPFPLSHYGLGEVTAFLFFGPVAVAGTYYLQTLNFHWTPVLLGFGPGLISAQLMSINNLRDRKNDESHGKNTIAVLLGEKKARYFCLVLLALSAFIPLIGFFRENNPWALLPVLGIIPFMAHWKRLFNGPIDSNLNRSLAGTGQYLFIYCLLLSLGLNLK